MKHKWLTVTAAQVTHSKTCNLCKDYAPNANYARIMQITHKLCTNYAHYADIKHKLCINYAQTMHFINKLGKNYA